MFQRFSFLPNFFLKGLRNKHNLLLIPGPVTTSKGVKNVFNKDVGSRDDLSIETIKKIRKNILNIAETNNTKYSTVLIPGSGTYANEAVFSSLPKTSYLGVFSNGVYGERLYEIAQKLNIKSDIIPFKENESIRTNSVIDHIHKYSHIAMTHNETSLGTINDIEGISKLTKSQNKVFIVDGISSFGGIPINLDKTNIDFLIASSNKCLHSFPGLGIVIGKNKYLNTYKTSKSLSLSLYDQWIELEKNNQFRYTPPIQIINALNQSINELIYDGGVSNRYNQYKKYNKIVRDEMNSIGIYSPVNELDQGPIVSTFIYPYKNFNYKELYQRLLKYKIIIYTATYQGEEVLRLGNIGHITEAELRYCLQIIKKEIKSMQEKH